MADQQHISNFFSEVSQDYAKFRPTYPLNFFEFLSSCTAEHKLALDVATGTGQAAVKLANYYEKVIATDASDKQLLEAVARPNVEYLCLPAELTKEQCEQNGFQPNSFDIVTCATAIHWLNLEKFFDTTRYLLKSGGIMAIVTYDEGNANQPEFASAFRSYFDLVRPTFTNRTVTEFGEEGYKHIHFPFEHVHSSWDADAKPFQIDLKWGLKDVEGKVQLHLIPMLLQLLHNY